MDLCITVYQAQQNYPKAVKACSDGGVAVMLVPEDVGNDCYAVWYGKGTASS